MNIEDNTTMMPMQVCPHCGYKMDCHTAASAGLRPVEDDFSFCINCGGVSRFDKDLTLKLATDEEMERQDQENYFKVLRARSFLVIINLKRDGKIGLDPNSWLLCLGHNKPHKVKAVDAQYIENRSNEDVNFLRGCAAWMFDDDPSFYIENAKSAGMSGGVIDTIGMLLRYAKSKHCPEMFVLCDVSAEKLKKFVDAAEKINERLK